MKKNNIYKPCRSGKENRREVQNHGEVPWFWFGVVTPVFASILRTKSSRNVTFTRPNFRSVPFFARPFSRESHHFAQPFLYVTFSLRDQIFAVLNFAIFSLREDKSSRFLTSRFFPFTKIKSSRRNGSLQYIFFMPC